MRILQIDSVYEFSSTGRATAQVHQKLIEKGHESYVAAGNFKRTEGCFIQLGNKFSRKYHSLMSHAFGRQGHYSTHATKLLVKNISRIKPDCVHLRTLHSNIINLNILLSFLADNDIPTVITLHDCWYFTGHCCYFSFANCNKWKDKCGNCPEIRNWNTSWFFDRSSDNLEEKRYLFGRIRRLAVVGVSDWVTSFVKDSILKDAAIIRRIYNWVDVDKFRPINSDIKHQLGIQNKKMILCCAHSWSRLKGIEDIKTVAEKMPEYFFVIIGKISNEFYPLPQNIISVGLLSSVDDLINYYSASDVFFNPSSCETFGKVTIEAMACGTPVVAYPLTATPELVNEECGLMPKPGDFSDIERCITEICKKGKKHYSATCRKFVLDNFSENKQMEEYFDLYSEICAL